MLRMETTGGQYLPLAGTGANTIRKMGPRYENLSPGDAVEMNYVDQPGGEPHAVERLIVRSVAIGPLRSIAGHHVAQNHGKFASPEICYREIKKIYGSDEGQFLAVYFV